MKTGDMVTLLDGSNVPNFYGFWSKNTMTELIGKSAKLGCPSSATDRDGKPLGYWVSVDGYPRSFMWDARALEPIKPRKILITWDPAAPKYIRAKELGTEKQATARCHPGDTFDFKTGALLACERLLTEEKPNLWSGIVICTRGWKDCTTVGRLYHVKNGSLRFDNGEQSLAHNDATSFKTFTKYFASEFVEYKGESQI